MSKKLKTVFKLSIIILIFTILILTISFNIWFSSGYMDFEDYNNPYFKSGDENFLTEAISNKFSLGFSKEILTPDDIELTKYYLAGYFTFPATYATEVLDDLYVRAICIDDNSGRGAVALAVIDSIGLSNKDVNIIREKLNDYATENNLKSINVMTTHSHAGIDTQGLWGPLPKSGKNEQFMENLFNKTVKAIQDANDSMTQGDLFFAETQTEGLFLDHREPIVIDDSIVRIRFSPDDTSKNDVYIINLSAHVGSLTHGNSVLTADFPAYMGEIIESYGNEFIFFNGAIGGLITTAQIPDYQEGMSQIEEMIEYGYILGDLIMSMDTSSETLIEPIINIKSQEIFFPLENTLLRFAGKAGVINNSVVKVAGKEHKFEIVSEIAYMQLGNFIDIVFVPGELFPELAIGGLLEADDSYSKTSFDYPLIKDLIPENNRLIIFGLANDEIGYIIPDNDYAITRFLPYIRTKEGHYEETVSPGRNTASILISSLEELILSTK